LSYSDVFNEIEEWRDRLRRTVSPEELIHAMENRIRQESDPQTLRILNFLLAGQYMAHGNVANAEAIRSKDPVEEIHRWYDDWNRENSGADIIPVLEERVRRESHPQKARAMRNYLAREYKKRGDYAAATAIHLDIFDADPSEPMPLIALAGQKFYDEDRPEEAMRVITQAVDVSHRSGSFRRLALGMQARIALRLQDYRVVEVVLKQIMDMKLMRRNADIGVERDFLDALPPDSIDPAVAQQYDEYCRARGVQRG
jgi:hypothetical protein